jgi:hypothetical protein
MHRLSSDFLSPRIGFRLRSLSTCGVAYYNASHGDGQMPTRPPPMWVTITDLPTAASHSFFTDDASALIRSQIHRQRVSRTGECICCVQLKRHLYHGLLASEAIAKRNSRRQRSANQASAGSKPESGAIFVATRTCSPAAELPYYERFPRW